MKVLITGASSGIGREMACILASEYDEMVLVGRNGERLQAVAREIAAAHPAVKMQTVATDLSITENCLRLYEEHKGVDFLINNAGFGDFGEFAETSVEKDLRMISTNVEALHVLMKLYLKDMVKRDNGRILNVASIAGFMPGPLMATYYATKAYVVRLSEAVRKELKKKRSRVKISILCPGPVKTNFEKEANIRFNFNGADVKKIARYALARRDRFYIVPTLPVKLSRFFLKISPSPLIASVIYAAQNGRKGPSPDKRNTR